MKSLSMMTSNHALLQNAKIRADWPKWKDAIQAELDSLTKRQLFGPVVLTPPSVKPIGHKWVFVRKRNEKKSLDSPSGAKSLTNALESTLR